MTRPDAPGPMLRRGPRPLLLHLTTSLSQLSGMSSRSFAAGSSGSKPVDGNEAGQHQPDHRPSGWVQDWALIAGIAAYRRHPYSRTLADPPSLWEHGEARLLDYGPLDGIPVLFVPSLINRGSILDLMEQNSLLRWLSARGIRTMLLEWGWPGAEERGFDTGAYVARRLEPAIAAAVVACGRRVVLAGYCMGGLFCVAAALRRPEQVSGLALIATPWDFHAIEREVPASMQALVQHLDALVAPSGTLPIDAIQFLFAGVDPAAIARKYREFGASPQDTDRARLFVAIEDWANDGVPLAGPVAAECLRDWYGQNLPGRGLWQVGGQPMRPELLALPSFAAIPQKDSIVPAPSAAALAEAIPGAVVLSLTGGHISLVAGPRAPGLLWEPLREWLRGDFS